MTKFEQARGRPKPPRINTWDHETYQYQHGVWAILRAHDGVWYTFSPDPERFAAHPTWQQAINWADEQMKYG